MTDYGNVIDTVIGGQRQQAQQGAVGSLDDDPEAAANAINLAKASGVPAEVIYANPEAFERNYKAALASSIVQRNPHIQGYINSNPMAAKVSNDDYGNLDDTSRAVSTIGDKSIMQHAIDAFSPVAGAATQGFVQGVGPGGPGSWMLQHPEEGYKELDEIPGAEGNMVRAGFAAAAILGSPFEVAFRGFSGILNAGIEGGKQFLKQQGMDPDQAEKLGNETNLMIQLGLMGGMGEMRPPPELKALAKNAQQTAMRVKPYIDAKQEVPFGVDPATDMLHVSQSKIDLDNLKESLAAAQKSATRERDPELFANFIRQHTDATIGISSEAVRKLYGDSTPMPDDGLLGWVPGIEDQLIGTQSTGGDIRVPLADWLARVEPDVAKELHDDIRVRGNGPTLNEAKDTLKLEPKEEPEPVEPAEGEHPQVVAQRGEEPDEGERSLDVVDTTRTAGGLEPLQTFGEKKVLLQKSSQGTGQYANVHNYDLVDETGKRVGDVQLTYDEAKQDLHVEYIRASSSGGRAKPNSLGPSSTRGIMRQLRQEF